MSPYSERSYSSSGASSSRPSSPQNTASNPLMSDFISSNNYEDSPYETRSSDHPSALTLYLDLRGVSNSSGYEFDHDIKQNPPASEFKGEAYSAIDKLSVAAYDSVQKWMASEDNQFASSNDTFIRDTKLGDVSIASSAMPSIEEEISALIEPSLQAYRNTTGLEKDDVNFEIRFNNEKKIGDWEKAFQNAPGKAGILPSPVGSNGGEYGSDNERSAQKKKDDAEISRARILAWRESASISGWTGQENVTVWEPSESARKLQDGELPGENVPSEAGSKDSQ